MEFSPDGRFLAVGGTDGILHVFEVSPHDTFLAPYKSYLGHKNRILDLAWIGQDIVTVSMDKTAVVWRLDMTDPVHIIEHNDIVTSV
jgi:WD40 repeat protein